MFVIIGMVIVLVAVLGGFFMEGGNFLVLMQYSEFIIIGGSATGALLIATPKSTLTQIVKYILGSLKNSGVSKASFLELLQLLYEIFQTARVKGLLTLEGHVEKPEESELFAKYPAFLKDHHTLEFLVDSLKLMVVGEFLPWSWKPYWSRTWKSRLRKVRSRLMPWVARQTPCRASVLSQRCWASS